VRNSRTLLGLVVLAVLAVTACGSRHYVTYIPEGGSYASGDLAGLLENADAGPAARVKADAAASARQEALASLRGKDDELTALVDMLTAEFPADVAAVPFLVERATVDGETAWIVLETWGEPGEELSHRRLWVFSASDLAVVAAQSLR
jgi:hypothetical protein